MVVLNPAWKDQLRRRIRDPDDGLLKAAVLAATALSLWLIWRWAYPPLVDAANVAYTGEVMHDLWGGGHHYAHWHALRRGAVSHMAFYGAYHLLRTFLPPMVTVKMLVTLGVLGLPAASYWLTRALRLSPWLCLPAFALAFNTNLSMGYLPFVVGIPLLPVALALIETNRQQPRKWRWGLLVALVALSPFVHFFLTAVLLPMVMVWLIFSYSGRARIIACAAAGLGLGSVAIWFATSQRIPPFREIFQWVPYSERWDQFDRDVLNWTTDGNVALSFPWLLVAFVAVLMLTRGTPRSEPGLRGARLPLTLLTLFLLYMLGPMYISWPEPAWGFGVRVGIAFALLLPLAATTSAQGWHRLAQYSPWVAFTFWHLCSLLGPFQAYDVAVGPLATLLATVPKYSTILPLVGSEWMKDPKRYSFGGFTGFALRHVANWSAVETQSYQPFSFCDMSYHPIVCLNRPSVPRDPQWTYHIAPEALRQFDFMVAYENTPHVKSQLRTLPMTLVKRAGDWSLWKSEGAGRP